MADEKETVEVDVADLKALHRDLKRLQEDLDKGRHRTSAPFPHNVAQGVPVSTLPVPKVPTSTFSQTGRLKPSLPEPVVEAAVPPALPVDNMKTTKDEPFEGYNKMTVGEVLKWLKENKTDEIQRNQILEFERANKNRTQIVETLVNWNS